MIHWIFYLLFKQAGPGVYILTSFIASNLSSGYARPNIYSWHEAVPCQFHRNDCSWSVPLIFLSVLRFLSPPQRLVPQENGEKTVKLINWLGGGGGNRGRMFLLQFSAPSVPQLSNQDGCGAFDFSEEHLIKISSRLWVKDTEAQSPPHPLI